MLHLQEILCKQQVLCTANSNHNKAIPEVYVLVLIWTDTTALWIAATFQVLAEVCIEEEMKAHTPSS